MKGQRVLQGLARIAAGVAAFAISAAPMAAPFSVIYSGVISDSTFTEIHNGEAYTVVMVLDNGGSTAVNQTWTNANVTCVLFTMNNAGDVRFAQDMVASSSDNSISGSVTTNGSGALTAIFGDVETDSPPTNTYSFVGFSPVPGVLWFLDSINDVFYDNGQGIGDRIFGDASGGVPMNVTFWTNPAPFSGTCSVSGAPSIASPLNVPTLGEWMVLLLTSLLAIAALAALRRRS